MNTEGFKQWLTENGIYAKPKLVTDCVSRAQRVEKAFQAVKPRFSYEKEYMKDEGASFIKGISRRGITLDIPVELPIGTNQMDSIASAAKKYFVYLKYNRSAKEAK